LWPTKIDLVGISTHFIENRDLKVEKKVDQKAEKNKYFAKTVSTPPTTVWHTQTSLETFLTSLQRPTKIDFFGFSTLFVTSHHLAPGPKNVEK
jgi:hypothetical protein